MEISYFSDDNINGIQDPEETDVAAGEDYVQLIVAPLMSSLENGTTERHALTTFPYIIQDIHPHLDISNLPTQIQLAENSGITELSLGLFAVNDVEEISVSISTTHNRAMQHGCSFSGKSKKHRNSTIRRPARD